MSISVTLLLMCLVLLMLVDESNGKGLVSKFAKALKEHTKNKRKSTQEKHQKGDTRKKADQSRSNQRQGKGKKQQRKNNKKNHNE
eukprot:CAMPEP_0168583550 /NCGR_PEP_ID=MMETSP0420-20121227/2628_1 /TAXON_ID=498008 /ORGANISM="Pessonella sp." /LENGTH=84 /DNA_ID=CAMNT_0008618217 /DNA_START=124 /DNA_END=375 /DNA_ORIENTATION=-